MAERRKRSMNSSSGFGLGQIYFADRGKKILLMLETLGEIAEPEGTPCFTVLFVTKFSFNVRKRGFASSWSFSKRFKERKQRSLQI